MSANTLLRVVPRCIVERIIIASRHLPPLARARSSVEKVENEEIVTDGAPFPQQLEQASYGDCLFASDFRIWE
ncbi:hypothetical protein R52603_03272 [Paraburkholderia saeva]|uniref:Uncharacterized protein n=1 Tax=Paraburkholderia saeva TaxID=2777537 RepID=A0A9N8X3B0_9BURK|nr:hypothetical protein R52603_03272 [Paraburkholderia saeva]CAG4908932.1 hypothetical protein LMG31841_03815 [Paraburkholderia saeva]